MIEEIEISESQWYSGIFTKDIHGDYSVRDFDAWVRFNEIDDICLTKQLTVDELQRHKTKAIELYELQSNPGQKHWDAEMNLEGVS